MKTSVIALIAVCFLNLREASGLKAPFRLGVEYREVIKDEGEPTYYELPSDAKLTSPEFQEMRKILLKSINQHNQLSRHNPDFSINPLSGYGVQYKVTITQKGEKEVWLNGFCKDSGNMYSNTDLTSTPVVVFDGGSCYFNLTINLKKRKASKVIIHGFA
jgi:hypothetical protein